MHVVVFYISKNEKCMWVCKKLKKMDSIVRIFELVEDNAEHMKEGDYLHIMNELKYVYEHVQNSDIMTMEEQIRHKLNTINISPQDNIYIIHEDLIMLWSTMSPIPNTEETGNSVLIKHTITALMNILSSCTGTRTKVVIVCCIYSYMFKHFYFLFCNETFMKIVTTKLKEVVETYYDEFKVIGRHSIIQEYLYILDIS